MYECTVNDTFIFSFFFDHFHAYMLIIIIAHLGLFIVYILGLPIDSRKFQTKNQNLFFTLIFIATYFYECDYKTFLEIKLL